MQGGGSKAQKDKPEGPSHTLEGGGWACSCFPPSQGASEDPLDRPPSIPWEEEGAAGRGRGELLPVVCYQIVPKLLKWRSSQLQQQKTQTMNAPPLNKE